MIYLIDNILSNKLGIFLFKDLESLKDRRKTCKYYYKN